jgi:16S rRNA processing protein RimM
VSSPEPGWVTIAVLGKTRGNRGEITALPLSSKPDRYQQLREVFLFGVQSSSTSERVDVETTWFHNGTLIFKFRGIDSIEDAQRLVRAEVRVPESERTALDPGEFFQSDLIGCTVVDRRTGEAIGRVRDFDEGGGTGLLVLENDLMIPFARKICVEIDPAQKRIAVELPEGLQDVNRS